MVKSLIFSAPELKDYMVRFFCKLNVPLEDAKISADVLHAADLRGVNSHGIIRLHSYYGDRLLKGLIDPHAQTTILNETPAVQALDGGNGLGPAVAYRAMQTCIQKAKNTGVGVVTVRNSNHYGIAGYYAMMALPHNMIGISLTNSQPLVAPTYGSTALLGTNPISAAVPAGKSRPYVLDMATSIVPKGRITVYQKAEKELPADWGMDQNGSITRDPNQILDHGALLPLGGSDLMRGYKGYGLSLLVDLLSGVLPGAAFGPNVGRPTSTSPGANVGHFFAALNIEVFRPLIDFEREMDEYIHLLQEAPKEPGQERIYIHGEKEFELEEKYQREGIPLLTSVVQSLQAAGKTVGVEFDLQPLGELEDETTSQQH